MIRCDNSRDLEMIPSGLSDFNIYGGLCRYVNRMYMPALCAPTILASAETDPSGQKGTLTVSIRLGANPPDCWLKNLTGKRVLQPFRCAVDKQNGVCPDAINAVNFALVGDGKLIDNQGTSTGSRMVQLYNGRALIRVLTNNGRSVVSVQSPNLPTAFFDVSNSTKP